MSCDRKNSGASDDQIATLILTLCEERGPGKTICPSEAARALSAEDGDWRARMDDVRRVGQNLMQEGRIEITQRGQTVIADSSKGPIRFRYARSTR